MKRVGKYITCKNGRWQPRYYIVRKKIPECFRKTVVFGLTGYGKSCNLIADAIRSNQNVLYISRLTVKNELEYMKLEDDLSVLSDYNGISGDFTAKNAYDFGQIPTVKQEEMFYSEVLPHLRASGVIEREDATIILDNLYWIAQDKELVLEMRDTWKCKVVLDFTCSKYDADLVNFFRGGQGWKLIPVFTPLYERGK